MLGKTYALETDLLTTDLGYLSEIKDFDYVFIRCDTHHV
jgi:hypothetical protein